ncbi:unnamed protein product [Prorocentrum cordatum]|uniref:Malonyl-CoA:ACP transacylase (MAT) domain-containing protein n=1 Tax=Prorocentrum cordatum TaxID=2364126 RepID=A0ABN9WEA0_9DINO|nr:unnamed protein product [Polarella glacialis]
MSRREPAARRKPACAAAAALAAIGIAGAKSAPKVAACLASQDAELRAEAARALGLMGAAGAKYEGDLVRLLGDASPSVAAAACCALGCLEARAQVGSLAPLLKSQFPAVRAAACQALGTMGPAAELHVEEVVRLLQDKSEQVASEAAAALPKCGEAAQVYASELCRLMLGDAPPAVRAAAALSLAAMGERGAAFQEEIEVLLQEDPAPEVQAAAESALRMIESHSTEVASAAARAAEIADAAASAAADAARAEAAAQAARAQLPLELAYVDPAAVRRPVALMFPGQGSQHVKMLQDVQDLPTVKDILAKANSILGYDILAICMEGPEEKLGQTRFCQPAMYIGGLAAVEKLKTEKPDVVRSAQCVAGLSLGEYVALTVAGALDVETGLRLVKLRGEAMQEAAEASPQMMASIAGLPLAKVEEICKECGVDGEVCQVANHLFPNGFACAGSKTSVERLVEVCGQTEGIIQARALKTSGAFHTKLMMPAREKLLAALKDVEPKMQPLRCDVYMNVTGQRLPAGTPPSVIIPMLADQLCSTVRWCPAMEAMIQDGIKDHRFYECGPMKQLKAMMKRISAEAFGKTASVTV